MSDRNQIIPIDNIQTQIFTIRGKQVMLDRDLGKKWFAFSKMEMEAMENKNVE